MGSRAFDKIALTAPGMAAWGHSRRIRPACFSGACPLLPESDSQPPKCVPSLRANKRHFALRKSSEFFRRRTTVK
jgi:hypothetical protein